MLPESSIITRCIHMVPSLSTTTLNVVGLGDLAIGLEMYDLDGSQISYVCEWVPVSETQLRDDQLGKLPTTRSRLTSFDRGTSSRKIDIDPSDVLDALLEPDGSPRAVSQGRGDQPDVRSTTQSNSISFDRGTSSRKIEASDPLDLLDALLDLYNVRRTAEEDGGVIPEEDVLHRAERVLRTMYIAFPRPYAVYPMPDGDIAIDAHSPHGTKVVVICDPDGSARCLTYMEGEFQRKEYNDPSVLPDDFVTEALRKTQTAPTR